MKVTVRKILKKEEEQVVIECVEITPEIKDIHSYVLAKGCELSGLSADQRLERFPLQDVYYEIKMRLYEAEQLYEAYHFVRCSKSVVLNLMMLESISPALNGRFFAHMKNGEKLMISRQYARKMKQIVMGGSRDES